METCQSPRAEHAGGVRPVIGGMLTFDARDEGARDLILAVFRLAIADYLGHSYGFNGQSVARIIARRGESDAAAFLQSAWARYLGDLVGCEASAIWPEAQLLQMSVSSSADIGLQPRLRRAA